MSRGFGNAQRAMVDLFQSNPSSCFTAEELAAAAYPGINRVEKKHRVAVLRGVDAVCEALWWRGWHGQASLVFFSLLDYRSYATGLLRAQGRFVVEWVFNPVERDSRAIAQHRSAHRPDYSVDDGYPWFGTPCDGIARDIQFWPMHVETFKAQAAGDYTEVAARLYEFNRLRRDLKWRGFPEIGQFVPVLAEQSEPWPGPGNTRTMPSGRQRAWREF